MKSNRPLAPLFATVNVTGVCNLRCAYCFFQPRLERHMPLKAFEMVIKKLAEARLFFVNLSGGEPFAHPQIAEILRIAHQHFHHVNVLTNGTLLRPTHLEAIAAIVSSKGMFPVQVSLDSVEAAVNDKTRGATARVLRNLERLNEVGANIVVAMVLSDINLPKIITSIRQLARYTRHFHVMQVQSVRSLAGSDATLDPGAARIAEAWDEITAVRDELGLNIDVPDECAGEDGGEAEGAPCMAGFSQFVVDPDLRVRPCDRCVGTFVGDLAHQSVDEIWRSPEIGKVLASPIVFCQRPDQDNALRATLRLERGTRSLAPA